MRSALANPEESYDLERSARLDALKALGPLRLAHLDALRSWDPLSQVPPDLEEPHDLERSARLNVLRSHSAYVQIKKPPIKKRDPTLDRGARRRRRSDKGGRGMSSWAFRGQGRPNKGILDFGQKVQSLLLKWLNWLMFWFRIRLGAGGRRRLGTPRAGAAEEGNL